MMMMATITTKTMTMMTINEDDNEDTNGEDNDNLIFDTTTNLWSDAFLAGSGVDLTMMTTETTTTKTRGDFDDHDNGNYDHKDNVKEDAMKHLIFDTTTNLWSDSFLEGRGW